MNFSEKLKKKIECRADKFQDDVYLADPEMVDSEPSKLFGHGANLLAPLLVECYELFAEIKRAKSSGSDIFGFADAVKLDAEDMIQKLESFVKDRQE